MQLRSEPIYPPTKRTYVVLDTETTGLNPPDSELLSVAVIDSNGTVLLDTYLTPEHNTRWDDAEDINGISPEFIFSGNFPKLVDIKPQLIEILRNKDVVMYNAGFDYNFLVDVMVDAGADAYDVMSPFADWYGDWSDYWQSNKWQKLTIAAAYVGHEWKADEHSAFGDCFATLDVWKFLTDVEFYNAVVEKKRKQEEARQLEYYTHQFLANLEWKERNERWAVMERADKMIQAYLGVWAFISEGRILDKARESASVFCPLLTGYSLADWETYGEYHLNLPRVTKAEKPDHLNLAKDLHFLKTGDERPKPVMMMNRKKNVLDLVGLYDLSQLTLGVDYVLMSSGNWPEDCYSETSLKKHFKLKPKQIKEMRPAYMRIGYKFNYLLYRYLSETVTKSNPSNHTDPSNT